MKSPCKVCGDTEPFHVHNGNVRIEDYFTVGRNMTDLESANAWKRRALDAELLLRLLQIGGAQFDGETRELRFEGLRYAGRDKDWSLLLDVAGRNQVQKVIAKGGSK